jgi:hypothetical protein
MWPTIDRARRRLVGDRSERLPAAEPSSGAPIAPETPAKCDVEDAVIIFTALQVDQLRVALQLVLGDSVERADTPARIERALSTLLADRGAPGHPSVLRWPAGLLTPESWEIRLEGVQPATGRAIREAGLTGVIAS